MGVTSGLLQAIFSEPLPLLSFNAPLVFKCSFFYGIERSDPFQRIPVARHFVVIKPVQYLESKVHDGGGIPFPNARAQGSAREPRGPKVARPVFFSSYANEFRKTPPG